MLAAATSAAAVVVAPPAAVARLAVAGLELARALSEPMSLAGWSTAHAAVSQADTMRIRFRETMARQGPLACAPDTVAFSFEGRERALMR